MLGRIAITVSALALLAAPAHAQKKPEIGSFPFWTAPKTPHAQAFVPGLQAALELTDDQIAKIATARSETIDSEEIRALRSKKKDDPNVSKEELAAAAEKYKSANEN